MVSSHILHDIETMTQEIVLISGGREAFPVEELSSPDDNLEAVFHYLVERAMKHANWAGVAPS